MTAAATSVHFKNNVSKYSNSTYYALRPEEHIADIKADMACLQRVVDAVDSIVDSMDKSTESYHIEQVEDAYLIAIHEIEKYKQLLKEAGEEESKENDLMEKIEYIVKECPDMSINMFYKLFIK